MSTFTGFPGGGLTFTSVPDLFFAELLPQIDDLAELKVTLHLIWLLQRRKMEPLWVSHAELERDGVLLQSLRCAGPEPRECLRDGLRKALERGTLFGSKVRVPPAPSAGISSIRSAAGGRWNRYEPACCASQTLT